MRSPLMPPLSGKLRPRLLVHLVYPLEQMLSLASTVWDAMSAFAGASTLAAAGTIPGADSAAYTNFIARTSGLNDTHDDAYKALLNSLTDAGLFASDGTSTVFDVLYIFKTQDATTANLNLVSSSIRLPAFQHIVFIDRPRLFRRSTAMAVMEKQD